MIGAAAAALIGMAAGVGYLTWPTAAAESRTDVKVDSEDVVRGDLIELVHATGKLRFGAPHDVGTILDGTITSLPRIGTVVGAGGELFRINDRPVLLFRGKLPMWRSFETGMEDGDDVLQLERNLEDLGFFDLVPDQEFGTGTVAAIKDWQESLGLDETGSIELGRIVFSPTDVRVAERKIAVGSEAGPDVLGVSGTTKEIAVSVDPDLSAIATRRSKVTVVLPNGKQAKGRIASVGAPVEQDDPTSGEKTLKLPLTITLDHPAVADGLNDVSVSIDLSRVMSEDALQVPVLALLATPGGGFAVEVLDGTKSRTIGVELGLFADGMVEVTGGDLAEGDRVVVGR